ncbi:MAG: isoleucine--tRNA ligase [Chloroflexi bacterium]|nr:isoleucine--tRNA ligase [Chloroflexota bacterium]
MKTRFAPVSPKVDISALEDQVLHFWRDKSVFQRTMDERQSAPRFVFYEGPPTANGRPGSHHVLARSFKDLFPRYKTMQGYYVLRKGGWDTHGLPVEIEVEKQLGISQKSQIEEYGIAAFNKRCRESVFTYIEEWNRLTERIAFWVDLENAYATLTNDYIQSVWWILKQFWDKGLLYQGYKVVPYSPTSGTALSSHEVALGYQEIDDPSIYVRFKAADEDDTYFLGWTTTPWTLPANTALTVGEDIDYVKLEGRLAPDAPLERLYLAANLVDTVVTPRVQDGGGYEVVSRMKGSDLVGRHYEPLYTYMPVDRERAFFIAAGDYVSTDDGTGIVHTAPCFGVDDLSTAQKYGLPVLVTVNPDGRFKDEVELVAGMWFKDADKVISRDLRDRGLVFHLTTFRHNYPHNWRDKSPLMYYARDTWFIRTTAYRDQLVALNQTINWVPEHFKEGRFGNWLEDVKDWALGRERYWGTPLPIWVADDPEIDYKVCIGSIAELEAKTGQDLGELDLHRPYVDDITWEETVDGKTVTMRRVPEVIDVWFDSGSMPVAQWGYPFANQAMFESQFPADYICEAVDQTRGWFYSLHAIATMLFESVSYKNVICLGHIVAADGSKHSKSKGNIVEPWAVINRYGADAMRWFMFTASQPGDIKRMEWLPARGGEEEIPGIAEILRNFYLKLWNVYSFFVSYANIDNFDPATPPVPLAERDLLDQWILSELHALTREVTDALETFDVIGATRPIEDFVDDLSNWYLRRSRRRFWQEDDSQDKLAALQSLYQCLVTLAKLLAPSMPFLSEAMYRNLVTDPAAPESVHLAAWPAYDAALIDASLNHKMQLVKRMVSLGHSARNNAEIKVRQPLAEASFALPSSEDPQTLRELSDMIADELNVKSVRVLDLAESAGMVNYSLKPVDTLGRELRKDFPPVRQMLVNAEGDEAKAWGQKLLNGENIEIEVNGKSFSLLPEQVVVRQSGVEGFAVAEDHGYLAALSTDLTDELVREGQAREIVRHIQELRKDADFDLTDRISVTYQAQGDLEAVMQEFATYIAGETLAEKWQAGNPSDGEHVGMVELDGGELRVGIRRV